MSSQKTTNYDLNQWLPDDSVLRTDFNADNAKIDAALQALADTAAGKADAGELSALSDTVAGHTAQIAKLGNCQLYTTTYTGTGTTSRTFSFPAAPVAVMIAGSNILMITLRENSLATSMYSGDLWGISASWSGNNLTLAYTGTLGGGDEKMGNKQNATYYMIALIDAETA